MVQAVYHQGELSPRELCPHQIQPLQGFSTQHRLYPDGGAQCEERLRLALQGGRKERVWVCTTPPPTPSLRVLGNSL